VSRELADDNMVAPKALHTSHTQNENCHKGKPARRVGTLTEIRTEYFRNMNLLSSMNDPNRETATRFV